MIVSRITINLEPEEQAALEQLCKADVRPPKLMIRYLIMSEARRRGLLADLNNLPGNESEKAQDTT